MTRYKELRRMERAIEDADRADLEWALNWARVRKSMAKRKDHLKTWAKREKLVLNALEGLDRRRRS